MPASQPNPPPTTPNAPEAPIRAPSGAFGMLLVTEILRPGPVRKQHGNVVIVKDQRP